MAREGADITIVYLPDEQQDAEATKQAVEKEGHLCLLIPGNLMDNETCKKAVDEHINKSVAVTLLGSLSGSGRGSQLTIIRYGKIDVLVNNASKQKMCKDFAEIDLEVVESTFRSNILQMFALTKYALPHMEKGSSYVLVSDTSTLEDWRSRWQDHQHDQCGGIPGNGFHGRLCFHQGSHCRLHSGLG